MTANWAAYLKIINACTILTPLKIINTDCLLVIDMQNDFVDITYKKQNKIQSMGKLAVIEGKDIIDGIIDIIPNFHSIVFTRDYHPYNHVSFIKHGGIFPRHCVQGTEGSLIVEKLSNIISYQNKNYLSMAKFFEKIGNLIDIIDSSDDNDLIKSNDFKTYTFIESKTNPKADILDKFIDTINADASFKKYLHELINEPINFAHTSRLIKKTKGADFHKNFVDVKIKNQAKIFRNKMIQIAFKGYHPQVDSYGAVKYDMDEYNNGLSYSCKQSGQEDERLGKTDITNPGKCSCCNTYTGSFLLTRSNLKDPNSPPDVLAGCVDECADIAPVPSKSEPLSLETYIKQFKRIFICGLALDFCVIDTAINIKIENKSFEVYIIIDLSRPVQIGGSYITSSETLLEKIQKYDVKIIDSTNIII